MGLFTLPFGVFFWILAVMIGNKPTPKGSSTNDKIDAFSATMDGWAEKMKAKTEQMKSNRKKNK